VKSPTAENGYFAHHVRLELSRAAVEVVVVEETGRKRKESGAECGAVCVCEPIPGSRDENAVQVDVGVGVKDLKTGE
jgi:hypothetical protein